MSQQAFTIEYNLSDTNNIILLEFFSSPSISFLLHVDQYFKLWIQYMELVLVGKGNLLSERLEIKTKDGKNNISLYQPTLTKLMKTNKFDKVIEILDNRIREIKKLHNYQNVTQNCFYIEIRYY